LLKMKKNKKNINTFLVLLFFFFVAAKNVHAQLVPCGLNGAADCTLCHLVIGFKGIYDYLLKLLLAASTMVIVIAGVMYMVSSGNKGMIDKAKSALTYALTAIILSLVAWLIINATLNALGYKNVGNWYTFTCDTTQTPPPAANSSGATLPASSSGGSSGSGKTLAGTIYEYGQKYYDSNGILHTDCSGYAQERRIAAGLDDPGRGTVDQMKNAVAYDGSQLREGSLLFSSSSASPSGRHVAVYNGDGTVTHNSGKGKNVITVPLQNYINTRNITGMLV
jgi:hypothetical protein